MEVGKSCNLRDDIDGVCDYICEYYRRVEEMGTTKSSAARSKSCETVEEEIGKASNCLDAPLQNNEIQLVQANIGKKRGRPIITESDLRKKLNRIRMNLNYSKNAENKIAIISDEDPGTTSIGNKVALLIAEAKVYTENVNGEECVSIASGLHIQDLISNCGCSVEKLPMIVGTVLSMLFGDVGDNNYSAIVKSHNTYAIASERTSLLVVTEISKRFLDRAAEERVMHSTLILDASNKKGKGCVGKIVIFVGVDGVVKQLALRLDTTVTKKALGSSHLTIESLETELGDGIVWIMGITTDAFGAAVEEAKLVLRHIDKRASEIYLQSPDMLHRKSLNITGQVYKYGGKFREQSIRTCQMHNFERILALLLSTLMGSQGFISPELLLD